MLWTNITKAHQPGAVKKKTQGAWKEHNAAISLKDRDAVNVCKNAIFFRIPYPMAMQLLQQENETYTIIEGLVQSKTLGVNIIDRNSENCKVPWCGIALIWWDLRHVIATISIGHAFQFQINNLWYFNRDQSAVVTLFVEVLIYIFF